MHPPHLVIRRPRRASVARIVAALQALAVCACSSAPSVSDAQADEALNGFTGCSGLFGRTPSPTGQYFATDFGCSSNPAFTDPGDTCGSASCIQSAYDQGVCSAGQSQASCQRAVNWYATGGARYGCGTRLQVTNPANGKSVVVMALDDGPACRVENSAGFWVLDVSYPTIMHLFGHQEGYADHARVEAVVVDPSTPLGPAPGNDVPADPPSPPANDAGPDPGAGGGTACSSDGDCNPGNDGSGLTCKNGECVPGCNTDAQCPGTSSCNSGQCR